MAKKAKAKAKKKAKPAAKQVKAAPKPKGIEIGNKLKIAYNSARGNVNQFIEVTATDDLTATCNVSYDDMKTWQKDPIRKNVAALKLGLKDSTITRVK